MSAGPVPPTPDDAVEGVTAADGLEAARGAAVTQATPPPPPPAPPTARAGTTSCCSGWSSPS